MCVVSAQFQPSLLQLGRLESALDSTPWSWIYAGPNQDTTLRLQTDRLANILSAGEVGLLAGRQKALGTFSEDIIIFLDDDVSLPVGCVTSLLEPFEDPDVHFVGCRYLPDYEHAPPAWMELLWDEQAGFRSLHYLSLLDGGVLGGLCSPMLVWGLCFAARRQVMVKLGGFHPDAYPWELRRFRGDGETGLAIKAAASGSKAYYQGATYVLHSVPAGRMRPEYFERRAFLQGISDSYTHIRRTGQVAARDRKSWKDLVRPTLRYVERELLLRRPSACGVRLLMARAHAAGVRYHQDEVDSDPRLLAWVLKPDYCDYRLPRGSAHNPTRTA